MMVNANTGHDCDLCTHTALTWECSFRLNQCHACHISCKKEALCPVISHHPSSTLLFSSSLHPLSLSCTLISARLVLLFLSAFLSPLLCIPPLPLVFKKFNVV